MAKFRAIRFLEVLVLASFAGYFVLPPGQQIHFITYLAGLVSLYCLIASPEVLKRVADSKVLLASILMCFYLALTSLWSADVDAVGVLRSVGKSILLALVLLGIFQICLADIAALDRLALAVSGVSAISAAVFIVSTFGDSIVFIGRPQISSVASMSFGFAAILAIASAPGKLSWRTALHAMAAAILLAAVYRCREDYVWVGLWFAIASLLSLYLWEFRGRSVQRYLFPCLVVSVLAGLFAAAQVAAADRELIWQPILDAAFSNRTLVGQGILGQAIPHMSCPGVGPIEKEFANCVIAHTHNIYVATLYYGGLLALFLQVIVMLLSMGYVLERGNLRRRGMVLSCLVFGFVTLVFDGDKLLTKIDFIWLLFWLPVALSSVLEQVRDKDPYVI